MNHLVYEANSILVNQAFEYAFLQPGSKSNER